MTYLASETSQWGGQPVELYRFTRGLTTWNYTTGDVEITYNGDIYKPVTMRRGDLPINEEKNTSNLEIWMDPTTDIVTEFISGATPAPTGLILIRRHRNEASPTEQAVIFVGQVGLVEFSEGEVHFTCVPIQRSVQRRVPRMLYQTQCNNMLYDVNCTVNPALFTVAAHISAIAGRQVTVPEAASKPDGYYNGGFFRDGDTYVFIMTHVGTLLTVLALTPAVLAGDNISLTAGCDRARGTCLTKFNNLDNFLGFPYIPDKNPYESGIA